MAGSSVLAALSSTSTLGVPKSTIYPSSRWNAAYCMTRDTSTFYIYGGQTQGYIWHGNFYVQTDLWSFSPSTVQWTQWTAESATQLYISAYGPYKQESSSSFPESIVGASCTVDFSGQVILFGGFSFDTTLSKYSFSDFCLKLLQWEI
jgi:hypothetical protein